MQKPYEDSPQMIENPNKGKLGDQIFVGGLSSNITEKELRSYFSQFGEVSKCQVCRSYNGKSKGFGFLSFYLSSARDAALGQSHHLNGQRLNIESVLARPEKSLRVASKHIRKIQVNNLPCWASKADISSASALMEQSRPSPEPRKIEMGPSIVLRFSKMTALPVSWYNMSGFRSHQTGI